MSLSANTDRIVFVENLVEGEINFFLVSILASTLLGTVLFWHRDQITAKRSNHRIKRAKLSNYQNVLERKHQFLEKCKDDYGYKSSKAGFIDEWRKEEFPNLIAPISEESIPYQYIFHKMMKRRWNVDPPISENAGEVYLDYAGSSLPSKSQLKQISDDIGLDILANPHSQGPAASRTMRLIEVSKKRILDYFNADPGRFAGIKKSTAEKNSGNEDDWHPGYEVVFTSGATDALRLLAERFPWSEGSIFAYPKSVHTSVIGMRESAQSQGASFVCDNNISALTHKLLDDKTSFLQTEDSENLNKSIQIVKSLLAFPLECNFSGERVFDAEQVIRKFQHHAILRSQSWYTLLDIAKAASSGPVNLRRLNPDFACVSFYKLFGEPTGLGCLLVKRSIVDILKKPPTIEIDKNNQERIPKIRSRCSSHRLGNYFGGGSVDAVLPSVNFVIPRSSPNELASLLNGTGNFRGIASLIAGFDQLNRLGGMTAIRKHTVSLARELASQLNSLKHHNGCPVAVVYGGWNNVMENLPGPVVAFNIIRSDGSFVGFNEVSKLAALNNPPIQLRTGCLCNPGACQIALGLEDDEVIDNYNISGHVCGDQIDILNNKPTGVIRVSFGKDSIWEDLDAFLSFMKKMFVSSDESLNNANNPTIAQWDTGPSKVIVSELYICPIKSCGTQRVNRWQLESSSGKLLFDREFALVDSSGSAMRLQTYPKMALIKPVIDIENRIMKVTATGCQSHLVLSLDGGEKYINNDEHFVKVCGNKCSATVWGNYHASIWFSEFLGVSCWLARHSKEGNYEISDCDLSAPIPKPIIRQNGTAFANEQPILLISERAVETLNEVLRNENRISVTSRQFRPNIVVRLLGIDKSCNRNAEDEWKKIETMNGSFNKKISFDVVGPCARCSMVDIDPTTGMKGKTLRALAQYRRKNGQIIFGIFLRANTTQLTTSDDNNDLVWIAEGDVLLCH